MIWKTDWTENDKHARNGDADVSRLFNNYNMLKALLVQFGFPLDFALPDTDGFKTLSFSDFLNAIEGALSQMHVFPNIPWVGAEKSWVPVEAAPTYQDVNRWEQNGKAVDDEAELRTRAIYFSGEIYSGEV